MDYRALYQEKLTDAASLSARVENGWSIGMDAAISPQVVGYAFQLVVGHGFGQALFTRFQKRVEKLTRFARRPLTLLANNADICRSKTR